MIYTNGAQRNGDGYAQIQDIAVIGGLIFQGFGRAKRQHLQSSASPAV